MDGDSDKWKYYVRLLFSSLKPRHKKIKWNREETAISIVHEILNREPLARKGSYKSHISVWHIFKCIHHEQAHLIMHM